MNHFTSNLGEVITPLGTEGKGKWADGVLDDYILNPDSAHVAKIDAAIGTCNGHCPCKTEQIPETICPCEDFRMSRGCVCRKYVERRKN